MNSFEKVMDGNDAIVSSLMHCEIVNLTLLYHPGYLIADISNAESMSQQTKQLIKL